MRINSSAYHECLPDWSWDTARINWTDTDLWYVSAGIGELRTTRGLFRLERGALFFLTGGERYRASHNPGKPLRVFAVHFEREDRLAEDLRKRFAIRIRDPLLYDALCGRIVAAWEAGDDQAAAVWLSAALTEARESYSERGVGKSTRRKRIETVMNYASENGFAELRVEDLARRYGASREHFSRVFSEETGFTPQEYLVSRRIDRARTLLVTSDYDISRIASILGYRDIFFFSRQFKERVGVSPSSFRRGGSIAAVGRSNRYEQPTGT